MKKLIAQRPVLYMGRSYERGAALPSQNQTMTEAWLRAGSAVWLDDGREPIQEAQEPAGGEKPTQEAQETIAGEELAEETQEPADEGEPAREAPASGQKPQGRKKGGKK